MCYSMQTVVILHPAILYKLIGCFVSHLKQSKLSSYIISQSEASEGGETGEFSLSLYLKA